MQERRRRNLVRASSIMLIQFQLTCYVEDAEGEGWVWSWKGKKGTWCEADINAWALEGELFS